MSHIAGKDCKGFGVWGEGVGCFVPSQILAVGSCEVSELHAVYFTKQK